MAIVRAFTGWVLCLQWVGATIMGLAAGTAVVGTLKNIFAVTLPGDWSAVMTGAWVGLTQWVVLRRHLSRAGLWVLASTAGWVLGLPVGGRVGSWANSQIMTAGLATASIGLMQWLFLRQQVLRAGWWVLASAAGWVIGVAVGEGVAGAMAGSTQSAVAVALGGTIIGTVTGIPLVLLLPHPSNKAQPTVTEAGGK